MTGIDAWQNGPNRLWKLQTSGSIKSYDNLGANPCIRSPFWPKGHVTYFWNASGVEIRRQAHHPMTPGEACVKATSCGPTTILASLPSSDSGHAHSCGQRANEAESHESERLDIRPCQRDQQIPATDPSHLHVKAQHRLFLQRINTDRSGPTDTRCTCRSALPVRPNQGCRRSTGDRSSRASACICASSYLLMSEHTLRICIFRRAPFISSAHWLAIRGIRHWICITRPLPMVVTERRMSPSVRLTSSGLTPPVVCSKAVIQTGVTLFGIVISQRW